MFSFVVLHFAFPIAEKPGSAHVMTEAGLVWSVILSLGALRSQYQQL